MAAEPQAKKPNTRSPELQSYLDSFNNEYEKLHEAFEAQFWGTKMALPGDFSTAKLTSTKIAMEGMLADPAAWRPLAPGSPRVKATPSRRRRWP